MWEEFTLPLRIRHSAKAKRLRLVVKPAVVELVVPKGLGEARALEFLRRQRPWVESKISELRSRLAAAPKPQPLATGTTVPFQGREVPLVIEEVRGSKGRVQFDGGFVIAVPGGASDAVGDRAKAALFIWVKAWLFREAGRLVELQSRRHGLYPREIRIKRMKTRWGSCGPRHDINLNWLLAFAPPSVLEYVVVHELCHIRHPDHSPRFWALVAEHVPGWHDERQWLKRHGADLLRRFA